MGVFVPCNQAKDSEEKGEGGDKFQKFNEYTKDSFNGGTSNQKEPTHQTTGRRAGRSCHFFGRHPSLFASNQASTQATGQAVTTDGFLLPVLCLCSQKACYSPACLLALTWRDKLLVGDSL